MINCPYCGRLTDPARKKCLICKLGDKKGGK